jgi:hypothetical protein
MNKKTEPHKKTRAASKAIITEISRIGNQTVRKLASLINQEFSSWP